MPHGNIPWGTYTAYLLLKSMLRRSFSLKSLILLKLLILPDCLRISTISSTVSSSAAKMPKRFLLGFSSISPQVLTGAFSLLESAGVSSSATSDSLSSEAFSTISFTTCSMTEWLVHIAPISSGVASNSKRMLEMSIDSMVVLSRSRQAADNDAAAQIDLHNFILRIIYKI